jgi:hypothetical protein
VILQGVSAGQKVVIAGQYRLQQGTPIQPTEASSPATPEKTAATAPVKAP